MKIPRLAAGLALLAMPALADGPTSAWQAETATLEAIPDAMNPACRPDAATWGALVAEILSAAGMALVEDAGLRIDLDGLAMPGPQEGLCHVDMNFAIALSPDAAPAPDTLPDHAGRVHACPRAITQIKQAQASEFWLEMTRRCLADYMQARALNAGAASAAELGKDGKIAYLMTLSGIAVELRNGRNKMLLALQDRLRQLVPNIGPDDASEIEAALAAQIDAALPSFFATLGPVYDARFSEAEIDALIAFFSSPVGRTMIRSEAEIRSEIMSASAGWSMQTMQAAVDTLERLVAEKGL
jgi:hypothetical protein